MLKGKVKVIPFTGNVEQGGLSDMELEKKVCPGCNGSGVYQEYDEYDRYHVHACGKCDGTGEITCQSARSAEVQRAIEWAEKNIRELVKQLKDLAETKERYDYQIKKGEPWKWEWEKSWRALAVERFQTEKKSAELAVAALQAYQPWIPVSERLPEKPEYDWVLVHITLYPDGFVGLPHVAELRRGEWFSTEYDLPIEQILQGTVTHWKPLPEPPKGECRE